MSDGAKHLRPYQFTPGNKLGGRLKGSKNKLNAGAWKALGSLIEDYQQHGEKILCILRVEKPEAYVRAALAATEIALKYTENQAGGNALVNISIQRFFPDKDTVTIDGQPAPQLDPEKLPE